MEESSLTNPEVKRGNGHRSNSSRILKMATKLKKNTSAVLTVLTLFGVILGFIIGLSLQPLDLSDSFVLWIGLPGELYLRILKIMILPLICSSIIVGTSEMDSKRNSRASIVCLTYITVTNTIGTLIGLAFSLLILPDGGVGGDISIEDNQPDTHNLTTEDIFSDMIRNFFPDNMVTATFQKAQTKYKTIQVNDVVFNSTFESNSTTIPGFVTVSYRSIGSASGTNIIGIIIVCSVMGVAAGNVGEDGRCFVRFFQSLYSIILKVLSWIIWITPVGVASLIAASIMKAAAIGQTFISLGYPVLTHVVCTVVYQMFMVPLLYFLFTRGNPLKFMLGTARVWMAGFAPPSSAAAIPEMMKWCEENGVQKTVSGFVVPLGAAICRDGSCHFIAIISVYVAKLAGVDFNAGTIFTLLVLVTVGALAMPAVHSSSLVVLLIILSSLQIQATNIGLILALEWFSDRVRTSSNVLSVLICATITNKFYRTQPRVKSEKQEMTSVPTDDVDIVNI